MRFWIVCILGLIPICSTYPVYVPYKYPLVKYPFVKYPHYAYGYDYDYSWPVYVYKSKSKYASSIDELKDYWFTFKDTFERKYEEITAPYIVERPVPIPVAVPINRVRTVYIKPSPKIIYRKIRYFKPR